MTHILYILLKILFNFRCEILFPNRVINHLNPSRDRGRCIWGQFLMKTLLCLISSKPSRLLNKITIENPNISNLVYACRFTSILPMLTASLITHHVWHVTPQPIIRSMTIHEKVNVSLLLDKRIFEHNLRKRELYHHHQTWEHSVKENKHKKN